jgi:hypothetical protein
VLINDNINKVPYFEWGRWFKKYTILSR